MVLRHTHSLSLELWIRSVYRTHGDSIFIRSDSFARGSLGYKKIYVDIGIDKMVKDMQESALEMLSRIPVSSSGSQATPKAVSIDPYSPYPCNSGKKYRFCCMKKSADPAPSRGLRFISL